MGTPIDRATTTTAPNPAGTRGLAFVEFSALDTRPVAEMFTALGFVQVPYACCSDLTVWSQGDATFVLNGASDTHGGRFAAVHGPGVSAIAFHVASADDALNWAVSQGAVVYEQRDGKLFSDHALVGVGGSLLYLVDLASPFADIWRPNGRRSDAGIVAVDHLTHNVRAGQLATWTDFYTRIFGFRDVFYLQAQGAATGFRTRALKSPCGRICIPLNEPTDPKSQIQEYIDVFNGEGVQHIALASEDLPATVETLTGNIPFMTIPDLYYAELDRRLPGHGEDTERLRRSGILVDGTRREVDGGWDLLLQIFSRNLIGPAFFELIQRKGNDGFGEGNATALFEAIERDQIRRGIVNP